MSNQPGTTASIKSHVIHVGGDHSVMYVDHSVGCAIAVCTYGGPEMPDVVEEKGLDAGAYKVTGGADSSKWEFEAVEEVSSVQSPGQQSPEDLPEVYALSGSTQPNGTR